LKNFSPFRIVERLALALKNRVCSEIFYCIEYIFYNSGFLSNFALAVKNRVCPEIFHCIKYTFYIQDFWAICACPENRVCPEKFEGAMKPPPPCTPMRRTLVQNFRQNLKIWAKVR